MLTAAVVKIADTTTITRCPFLRQYQSPMVKEFGILQLCLLIAASGHCLSSHLLSFQMLLLVYFLLVNGCNANQGRFTDNQRAEKALKTSCNNSITGTNDRKSIGSLIRGEHFVLMRGISKSK